MTHICKHPKPQTSQDYHTQMIMTEYCFFCCLISFGHQTHNMSCHHAETKPSLKDIPPSNTRNTLLVIHLQNLWNTGHFPQKFLTKRNGMMMIHLKAWLLGPQFSEGIPTTLLSFREMGDSKVLLLTQTLLRFNHFRSSRKLTSTTGEHQGQSLGYGSIFQDKPPFLMQKKHHPARLIWKIIIEVWKIIFLSKWEVCMFHVNLPAWRSWGERYP